MTTCPNCSSNNLVGFNLAPKGEPLEFRHCRDCEHRWWREPERDDAMALGAVLSHIGA